MEYKRLEFVANKWLDTVNEQGVRVIEPVFDGTDAACSLVCTPIPGSDPTEVEYSCSPSSNCDLCELITETTPDGATLRWCQCVSGPGVLNAAKAALVPAKSHKKAKNKRKK